MNDVIIVKHKRVPAPSAREGNGTSFVIGLGRHGLAPTSEDINTDQGRELHSPLPIKRIGSLSQDSARRWLLDSQRSAIRCGHLIFLFLQRTIAKRSGGSQSKPPPPCQLKALIALLTAGVMNNAKSRLTWHTSHGPAYRFTGAYVGRVVDSQRDPPLVQATKIESVVNLEGAPASGGIKRRLWVRGDERGRRLSGMNCR
jgi:hypothetical protein